MAQAVFIPFGTSHFIVLVVTILLAVVMIGMARRQWRHAILVERTLALFMLSSWPGTAWVAWSEGHLGWDVGLPLHYCNVATFAAAIALWTHRRLACEIAYFFGLAGMLQGLLTPALRVDFPAPLFFFFFLYHVGGVVTAFYVVLGLRICPGPRAVTRMCGWSFLYLIVACLANWLLGTNYGFFCAKPPSPSLMDKLGPWPWYVGALIVVAWLYYLVLNLPFVWRRRRMNELSLPRKCD